MTAVPYIGRFAPSPTGLLHAGSLVAAMASYLDARAHNGRWLVRIEDVDMARAVPGAADAILATLDAFGMHWDGSVITQSERTEQYAAALRQLGLHAYPCSCSRREVAESSPGIGTDGALIYPGTCRDGLQGKPARAVRLRVPDKGDDAGKIRFSDRWQGVIEQDLAAQAGDFVLKRADGFWAYQLAVVVDDAAQGVTDVVRGADLLGSTPRQIYLQRLLGLPTPCYLHVPILTNAAGEKLSKQTGATPADPSPTGEALIDAAAFLGMRLYGVESIGAFWTEAVAQWRMRLAGLTVS